jgi:transcriptional regulator with XRE-family HTH domain
LTKDTGPSFDIVRIVSNILEDDVVARKRDERRADDEKAGALDGAEGRVSRERPLASAGDEVGAAEMSRHVAEQLRERRKARGMSLDDLARASGVSRAALSQVETLKSNPTLGLLWKIAVGLGMPMSELIGERRSGAAVLRRRDAQVLRSLDGKLESRALTPAGASPLVEVYELKLAARGAHVSEPHAPGTREIVVVLTGSLRLRVGDEVHELAPGDSIAFAADRAHSYENPAASDARYHNVIIYER